MKKALTILQSILLPLLLLAGLAALALWAAKPLQAIPHLHLNPGRLNLRSALLFGGALLSLAFALLAAVYTLFNLREPIYKLLLPVLAFAALGVLCRFCFLNAVQPLTYTYTESVEDFYAESKAESFRTRHHPILPADKLDNVTGYRYYSDGRTEAELVTVTLRVGEFARESSRIRAMSDLTGFQAEDWQCYDLVEDNVRYQVRLNKLIHQVVYCRYVNQEDLPAVAPQPVEEPEPETEAPRQTQTTESTTGAL